MRQRGDYGAWMRGGPFIGTMSAARAIVTVEPNWRMKLAGGTAPGEYPKRPFRYFQDPNDSPTSRFPDPGEVPVPNVKSISWDKSVDQQSSSCTIAIYNTAMMTNSGKRPDGTSRPAMRSGEQISLGEPGYFTWDHGGSKSSRARWKTHLSISTCFC